MSADDLFAGPRRRLPWNREPDGFWFHYTTATAAEAIYRTGAYRVGRRRSERAGLFVTRIQPGAASSPELLNRLFDGTRNLERTRATVVIRADAIDLVAERESRDAWRLIAESSSMLDLRDAVVGWTALTENGWRYSSTLLH